MRIPGAGLLGLEPLPYDDQPPEGYADPVRRRSPWWRRALWTVVVAALVAGVGWVVAFSPVLGVRTVDVRGEALLTEDQIRAAAGIAGGTPLVRLDTGSIRARVAALPEIESVRVAVSYPSSVLIDVVERAPVGYRTEIGGIKLVDRSGLAFLTVEQAPEGLPQLPAPPPSGRWEPADAAAALACAQVAAALPEPLRAQVATIDAHTENSVQLGLADGRTVIWGGSVRNEQKAQILVPLLAQEGDVFDISAEGVAVVR